MITRIKTRLANRTGVISNLRLSDKSKTNAMQARGSSISSRESRGPLQLEKWIGRFKLWLT